MKSKWEQIARERFMNWLNGIREFDFMPPCPETEKEKEERKKYAFS